KFLLRPEVLPGPHGGLHWTRDRAVFGAGRNQMIPAPAIPMRPRDGNRIAGMVETECSHDRQAGLVALSDSSIKIRQESITEIEILAADRLHPGVVQLAGIGVGGAAGVGRDFVRAKLARIPPPGQAQVPGTSV